MRIIGAKGQVKDIDSFLEKVDDFSKEKKVVIQALNADMIYGKTHLVSAVEHAKRAMDRKKNTTNSLSMEILLYASGERQLKLAIPKMGVKEGKTNIAFVLADDKIDDILVEDLLKKLSLDHDDKVLQGDINTLKKFGIKKESIATVSQDKYLDLILEKVALVDIIK